MEVLMVLHMVLVAVLAMCGVDAKVPKSQVVRCAVCRSLVSELHAAVNEVDPRKKIDVGSYRIESDGGQKLSSVKYAGSEIHMMDVMESVCGTMKDYAQARHKETGKLEAIKLVVNGGMNPRFAEYEMVQDPDLNKGLEFHCDNILEDFEEDVVAHFREHSELDVAESQGRFCDEVTKLCQGVKDEL